MLRNSRILAGLLLSCLLPATSLAQAPGYESAVIKVGCDYDCLIGTVDDYVAAMAERDTSRLPLADDVVFSENNVVMPLGNDGLWGTINGVHDGRMAVADEITGNAAWFGIVEEHGNPAYLAIRMKVEDDLITEIETVVNRLHAQTLWRPGNRQP